MPCVCALAQESNASAALEAPSWALKSEEPSPQRYKEACRFREDLDASGFDRLPGLLLASAAAAKPAAVQPFVPRDALRLHRVTTVPYHVEAG